MNGVLQSLIMRAAGLGPAVEIYPVVRHSTADDVLAMADLETGHSSVEASSSPQLPALGEPEVVHLQAGVDYVGPELTTPIQTVKADGVSLEVPPKPLPEAEVVEEKAGRSTTPREHPAGAPQPSADPDVQKQHEEVMRPGEEAPGPPPSPPSPPTTPRGSEESRGSIEARPAGTQGTRMSTEGLPVTVGSALAEEGRQFPEGKTGQARLTVVIEGETRVLPASVELDDSFPVPRPRPGSDLREPARERLRSKDDPTVVATPHDRRSRARHAPPVTVEIPSRTVIDEGPPRVVPRRTRGDSPEPLVVRIGTIEVRPRREEARVTPPPPEPVGFDGYYRVRNYIDWD